MSIKDLPDQAAIRELRGEHGEIVEIDDLVSLLVFADRSCGLEVMDQGRCDRAVEERFEDLLETHSDVVGFLSLCDLYGPVDDPHGDWVEPRTPVDPLELLLFFRREVWLRHKRMMPAW